MLKTDLKLSELKKYLVSQIRHIMPDSKSIDEFLKDNDIENALAKIDYCFSHIKNSAFTDGKGNTFFSHLHADQYSMFLVYLSNIIWNNSHDTFVCDKIMYLNRVLHSFFMSYKAKVPDIFWLGHPVGSVIGNADYSNYLLVMQNCTINTGGELKPKIGEFFTMSAGSAVIGDKNIGNKCSIGANALLYNKELEDNSMVINDIDGGGIKIIKNKGISLAEKVFYL